MYSVSFVAIVLNSDQSQELYMLINKHSCNELVLLFKYFAFHDSSSIYLDSKFRIVLYISNFAVNHKIVTRIIKKIGYST